ncbi:fatty acid--CoA ligase [Bradyrhizobium sp. U87765 SZCCT0131]|uniref:fatty acid--CoA ligase n=1 Tax=unclassified Bradyrhizobium TaxID=2631580 RepID=UPI001BAA290B|nr:MULTISPECIES: fatty acid--CoA ligase [unclassified Bradyrhizobium]MBR1218956.1 fatty acid--CoA ligase [Bradyrhizobium sp. U87765 SZCCT0131]MBR1261607.1 fatty acid--CoA ligase [Bradyrhizobium sp. U87765 SZCCT0134]MBR1306540.1 fatty acid--CoA ligase [Bradyrhizobium sp. U87765 SZCCT0110]MBR1317389.1 fatty acid--CoA ligase [Bradyrhizobium sp. U87765 SZCCT0109]MBR1351091.1 fatty acid--CoA ligase [Bradyrhizobium sp. U87765 SZCCT0048]
MGERTLLDVVSGHAQARGDAIAFTFEGRETSYGAFERHANKVAHALTAAGLGKGDRIAYVGKNSDHYFELLIGAMKVGVVMVPVNWRLAPPEMVYIIDNADAKMLFVGREFVEAAQAFAPRLTSAPAIVAMEGATADWPAYEAWRDAHSDAPPAFRATLADVALQLYTSGTTGHPKGAMLSHSNLIDLRDNRHGEIPAWNVWTSEDVSLVAMPVFHIGGTGWGIFGLYYGAKGVVAREFDPSKVLDYFVNERISKLFMVPAAMQFVVRHPRARTIDYSRLKYLLYGASPIPADLLKECIEVFGCGFVQMYGMTETTGTIVVLPPEDHTLDGSPRLRSAGKAMPGVEIAILDADGKPLPVGEVGEIATRSAANMVGYWKLPEATARTLSKDNWLRTGDAGYMDADGYVYVHDRIKDMIISGAENIYPAEVENAIFGHPAVAEVAVIGVPDDKWGEAVKAVVVRKPGAEVTAEEIIAHARQNIAGYKVPKSVDFIAALPRNGTGKILRRELRDPFWAGRERQVN